MILTADDRQRIADAFRERIGPLALRTDITVDEVCTNLVLAIPALLETCNALERECERLATHAEGLELERGNFETAASLRVTSAAANNDKRLRSIVEQFSIDCEDCEDAIVAIRRHIAKLAEQLKEDPCP